MARPALLELAGLTPYRAAWSWQHRLAAERLADRRPDTLLLLEHPPVFTVGRRGGEPAAVGDGVPLVAVERGGGVTYHGPGQLVGYPIMKLAGRAAGPKAFVQALEDVLLSVLRDEGISGERRAGLPGIWVAGRKIASIGLHIGRGVTMHGFALNVAMDLTPFDRIVPCGLPGCRMTSMAVERRCPVAVEAVQGAVARRFAERFDLQWTLPGRPGAGAHASAVGLRR